MKIQLTNTETNATNSSYRLADLSSFGLDEVLLTDDYYKNAVQKEIDYLLSFHTDKLLAGFRDTAGIDMRGATRYPGWETSLIGGHTMGHYLTACVQAYQGANTTALEKEKLLTVIADIVDGLAECQDAAGTGFLFGSTILDRGNTQLQFDNVEKNLTNIFTQAWVPWYTMHKILEGLLSVARMSEDSSIKVAVVALSVASRLGDWVCHRVSKWTEKTRNTVLGIEYGGMNDCLYDLYQLTKQESYAKTAHAFDQVALFDHVLNGKDGDNILNNYHANTTIPKFLGALNRYLIYRKDDTVDADIYLQYAQAFWDMVVKNHTYITGGNSEWEHFGLDDILDAERTNCNCETCNAYNMLKLTKKLFMLTGDVKYANYYETTFLNSILSSQDPTTGMTTYFQPMATGYFKVYSERFTKFWCCTGSGMENFSKLGESFYYHKENILVVNQYISSELVWAQYGIKLIQETDIVNTDKAVFTVVSLERKKTDLTIALRLPDWLAEKAAICVDGMPYRYETEGGYAMVDGPFADQTKIEITLPMKIVPFSLPDKQNIYGFKYGPVVLSALLGTNDMAESVTGVDVTIPLEKRITKEYVNSESDTITVVTDSVNEFIENINDYMVKDEASDILAFKLQNTDAKLTFVTHYSQYTERYGIYWNFISKKPGKDDSDLCGSEKKDKVVRLDTVQPGYGQYENDALHNMQEYGNGSTGDTSVGTSRCANANGSFSYRMIIDPNKGCSLLATFKTEDNGKSIKISVRDTVVFEKTLQTVEPSGEYRILIPLPVQVLINNAEAIFVNNRKESAVTFTFEGVGGEASARLCHFLYSVQTEERVK